MIEEDTIAAEHVVGIAIFFDDPISIELGYCIGAEWMRGGVFVLWHFLDFAIEFGG